jgi:DHA1 family tetracycline resistance protein-like MFS transporter
MLTVSYALFANERFHFDAVHTGYMFTYVGVIGAIIQGGLLGRLVKVFGEKTLAVAGTIIFSAGLFALPLAANVGLLLAASTGIAIGNSFVTPTLNALASKSVPASFQGRILGIMASVASLARIFGPVMGGFLLGRDSNLDPLYGKTVYWVSGSIMLVALALAISLHIKSESTNRQTVAVEK